MTNVRDVSLERIIKRGDQENNITVQQRNKTGHGVHELQTEHKRRNSSLQDCWSGGKRNLMRPKIPRVWTETNQVVMMKRGNVAEEVHTQKYQF